MTDVVLAEAAWTLEAAFEQDRHAKLIAVRSLPEEAVFAFEDRLASNGRARTVAELRSRLRCR